MLRTPWKQKKRRYERTVVLLKANAPVRTEAKTGMRLTPIPEEVYFEIFSHFDVMHDEDSASTRRCLMKLMFTCRLFFNLVLPRLFRALETDGAKMKTQAVSKQAVWLSREICRSLNRQGDPQIQVPLSNFPRACTFRNFNQVHEGAENLPLMYMFGHAMIGMSNLYKLELFLVDIVIDFQQNLAKMKTLKILRMTGCTFSQGATIVPSSELSLTSLICLETPSHYTENCIEACRNVFIGPHLEELALEAIQCITPPRNPSTLELLRLHPRSMPALRSLTLASVIDDPSLWLHICEFKDLKSLGINRVDNNRFLRKNWKARIPNVESFACPASLMPELPTLPLTTLDLQSFKPGELNEPELEFILLSASQLTTLIVPANIFLQAQFGELCPNLKDLRLTWRELMDLRWLDVNHMVNDFLSKKIAKIFAQKLHIETGVFLFSFKAFSAETEKQRKGISRIVELFPHIEIVELGNTMGWERREDIGTWHFSTR